MTINKKTLEYLLTENDEHAGLVLENIFDRYNDGLNILTHRKHLLNSVREVIATEGIDNVEAVEKAIHLLFRKYFRTHKQGMEIMPDRLAASPPAPKNAKAQREIRQIERSAHLTETEKQALFNLEDPAYETSALSGITEKARWRYISTAMTKLRMIKALGLES